MADYGKAISTLRKKKGMTQADLATSLNISSQAVSKWENNLSQPDLETVKKMLGIFEVSWEEFDSLTGENMEKTAQAAATKEEQPAKPAAAPQTATPQPAAQPQKTANQLFGVCAYCGKAIYEQEELEVSRPKIVCKDCASHWKKGKLAEQARERASFKKSLIVPAVILGVLAIIIVIVGFTSGEGAISLCAIPMAFLMYLPIPQIIWCGEGPVSDIFEGLCLKTIHLPGVIFGFDIGGFILGIALKIALSILGLILGVVLFLFGYALCMIIAPFSFIHEMNSEKKDIQELSTFTVAKLISDLDANKYHVD